MAYNLQDAVHVASGSSIPQTDVFGASPQSVFGLVIPHIAVHETWKRNGYFKDFIRQREFFATPFRQYLYK